MQEETPTGSPSGQVGLPVVVARIVIVSAISFAAAVGLFLLIGGVWQVGLLALATMFILILLMFLLERAAEGRGQP